MITEPNDSAHPSHGTMGEIVERGLTKREYFAAMAMQGYLSSGDDSQSATHNAIRAADALIAELNK